MIRKQEIQKRPKVNTVRYTSVRQRFTPKKVKSQKMSNQSGSPKIAIVQGGAWGDNINSTLMFKPIKDKYPECRLDVHTSTLYSSAFDNNPHIDNIITYETYDKNSSIDLARTLPERLNYDIIKAPHPMFNPDKWSSALHQEWGENLIFSWVRALEEMDVEYKQLETVLRLTQDEIDRARRFLSSINNNRKNVLMEIFGESGQTFWDHTWTIAVGEHLAKNGHNVLISHKGMKGDIQWLKDRHSNVHWIGDYSIRECAEIFNHCEGFISVSSGLSNACNTNWCKKDIKWFEVVNSITCSSAAIRKDGKSFIHSNDINAFINKLKEQNL